MQQSLDYHLHLPLPYDLRSFEAFQDAYSDFSLHNGLVFSVQLLICSEAISKRVASTKGAMLSNAVDPPYLENRYGH